MILWPDRALEYSCLADRRLVLDRLRGQMICFRSLFRFCLSLAEKRQFMFVHWVQVNLPELLGSLSLSSFTGFPFRFGLLEHA